MTEGEQESEKITVTFKVSGGEQFEMDLKPEMTILDIKKAVEERCQVPALKLRLIYKGRILKDDDTVEQNKVKDGHAMHLLRGAVPPSSQPQASTTTESNASTTPAAEANRSIPTTAATATIPGADPLSAAGGVGGMAGMGGMGGLGGMDLGAMMQAMQNFQMGGGGGGLGGLGGVGGVPGAEMRDAQGNIDTAFLSQALQNPMVQTMMQQLMSNPELIQNIISTNPALQQLTATNPQLGSALNDPTLMQQLMNPAAMQSMMAAMSNTGGAGAERGVPGIQPNPMMNPMMQQLLAGGAPVADNRPPQERFASQLSSLEEMGFIDKDANIQALLESNGNVNQAINRLLERGLGN